MFLVAVTGGIASGKSTVCRMFADLGCPVIDADRIAREVVEPMKPAWYKLHEHFGDEYFHSDGTLNREKLGQLVFSDSEQRKIVDSATHREIQKSIVWQLVRCLLRGEQFVVLELPLLFESGKLLRFINTVIVVYCSEEVQRQRLCDRTGCDVTAAQQRIDAQMPLSDKCRQATVVIDNMGSDVQLEQTVHSVCVWLRGKKTHWKIRLLAGSFVGFVTVSLWFLWKMLLFP